MAHYRAKNLILAAVLAFAVSGCGNGSPIDGFTVHGLGEAETSVISGENRPEAGNYGAQTSKNTVEADAGANIGNLHNSNTKGPEGANSSAEEGATTVKPTPPMTSPTTTAPTTTEPEVTVATEGACAYKVLHTGNYSTEYYNYVQNGNVLTVSCSYCNAELGSIDLIGMTQAEFEATNRERAAAGLSPLTFNAGGTEVSFKRAKEIVGDFSHNRFEQLTAEEYAAIGFVNTCGENICMFGLNPDSMNAGEYANTLWMNSPGHRENVLNGAYSTVAISVYFDPGTKCLYWVQLFGG